MGNAGADGHSIRVMTRPGRTFPLLAYLSIDSGGAVIEQMKYVVFLNGRWFDVTALLKDAEDGEGNPDIEKLTANLMESEVFSELMNALSKLQSPADILDSLALDIQGGETIEIPNEGLDKIDLSTGLTNLTVGGTEEPNNRKSRPKLP